MSHLSHTYHGDKHFFGTAEFYAVGTQEHSARLQSRQRWPERWNPPWQEPLNYKTQKTADVGHGKRHG
jgi:hypothetical protein